MNIYRFFIFLLLCLSNKAFSQHYFGVQNSNYAGIASVYNNPANISDSRFWFDINLISTNLTFNNSVFTSNGNLFSYFDAQKNKNFTTIGKIVDLTNPIKANEYKNSRNALFSEINFTQNADIYANVELRGPSLMIDVLNKFGIGFTTRLVSDINILDQAEYGEPFNNIDRYLMQDTPSTAIINQNNYFGNLKTAQHTYGELGFTLAANIFDNGYHFIKAGITLKGLVGINYSIFKTLRSSIQIIDPRVASKVELEGELDIKTYSNPYIGSMGNVNELVNYFFNSFLLSNSKSPFGWGTDYGLVYEYRPNFNKYKFENTAYNYTSNFLNKHVDYTKNKYALKVSVALQNIGFISYIDSTNTNQTKLTFQNRQNLLFKNPSNIVLTDFSNFNSYLINNVDPKTFLTSNIKLDTSRLTSVDVRLPASLMTNIDLRITDNLYVSVSQIYNFALKYKDGTRKPTLVNITPRFESKYLDIGLPITYNAFNDRIYYGFGFRLGPLTFGLDDIHALLGNFKGINMYAGLRFSIVKSPPFRRFYSPNSTIKSLTYSEEIKSPTSFNSLPTINNVIRPSLSGYKNNMDVKNVGGRVLGEPNIHSQFKKPQYSSKLFNNNSNDKFFDPNLSYSKRITPETKIDFTPSSQQNSLQQNLMSQNVPKSNVVSNSKKTVDGYKPKVIFRPSANAYIDKTKELKTSNTFANELKKPSFMYSSSNNTLNDNSRKKIVKSKIIQTAPIPSNSPRKNNKQIIQTNRSMKLK